jgi:CRP-like cAMP-binding protein
MPTSSEALRQVPLFQAMTDRSVDAIADLAEERDFATDEPLVRQGDEGDSFFVIVEGTASVTQDGAQIRELGPGDFLGEIALIDGQARTATVVATTPIRALVIGRDGFRTLLDRHAGVRFDVLAALAQRLRQRAPATTD